MAEDDQYIPTMPVMNKSGFFKREILLYSLGDISLHRPIPVKKLLFIFVFIALWTVPLFKLFGSPSNVWGFTLYFMPPIMAGEFMSRPIMSGRSVLDLIKVYSAYLFKQPACWLDLEPSPSVTETYTLDSDIWISRRKDIAYLREIYDRRYHKGCYKRRRWGKRATDSTPVASSSSRRRRSSRRNSASHGRHDAHDNGRHAPTDNNMSSRRTYRPSGRSSNTWQPPVTGQRFQQRQTRSHGNALPSQGAYSTTQQSWGSRTLESVTNDIPHRGFDNTGSVDTQQVSSMLHRDAPFPHMEPHNTRRPGPVAMSPARVQSRGERAHQRHAQ